jgi:hypothetical protein
LRYAAFSAASIANGVSGVLAIVIARDVILDLMFACGPVPSEEPRMRCDAIAEDGDAGEKSRRSINEQIPSSVTLMEYRRGRITSTYTLNRMLRMSPSATTYSFPSSFSWPASRTACSDRYFMN